MNAVQRRKQRLTWEAIGREDPALPETEVVLRVMASVALVLFIVLISATYPA